MENYETVVAALNGLKQRGYTLDFNIAFDKLACNNTGTCLNPDEFEITEIHRFEGATDPDDQDIVYAVASYDGSIKGTLTSAYGVYAEDISADMIRKLSVQK